MITVKELLEHLNDYRQYNPSSRTGLYDDVITTTNVLIKHIPDDLTYKINRKYRDFQPVSPDPYMSYANVFHNVTKGEIFTDVYRIDIKLFYPTIIKNLLINLLITEHDVDFDYLDKIRFEEHKKVFLYLIENYEECKNTLVREYLNSFFATIKHQASPYIKQIHEHIFSNFDYMFIDIDTIFVKELSDPLLECLTRLDLDYEITPIEYFCISNPGNGYYVKEYEKDPCNFRFPERELKVVEEKVKVLIRDKRINELL